MLRELSIDEVAILSGGDGRSQAAKAGAFIQGALGGAAIGAGLGAFGGGVVFPGIGAVPGALVGSIAGGLIGGSWGIYIQLM